MKRCPPVRSADPEDAAQIAEGKRAHLTPSNGQSPLRRLLAPWDVRVPSLDAQTHIDPDPRQDLPFPTGPCG
eukprot:12556921-Heterocapsa_arctica.AAC.1